MRWRMRLTGRPSHLRSVRSRLHETTPRQRPGVVWRIGRVLVSPLFVRIWMDPLRAQQRPGVRDEHRVSFRLRRVRRNLPEQRADLLEDCRRFLLRD
jgi:hypothetical protein